MTIQQHFEIRNSVKILLGLVSHRVLQFMDFGET